MFAGCFVNPSAPYAYNRYPKQPWFLHAALRVVMSIAAFTQRYFLLPRISPRYPIDLLPNVQVQTGCPRLHPVITSVRPWYRPEPTGMISYCQERLLVLLGWYLKMPGPHLKSQGYRLEEMGPIKFENAGHEEIMQHAAELLGCPVDRKQ
ncbi:hypothetical protein BDZ97DRAFT_1658205 [Flammula alnicola]|nr:hypothetical protein BDZ97DRAFT_1658205 [Flammula alnicola]